MNLNKVTREPDNFEPDVKMEYDLDMDQVGDQVSVGGVSGDLLCSSEMGVTSMDIFNDVLTDYDDLRSFLGPGNYTETDRAALAIKGYLKFCNTTNTPLWEENQPVEPDQQIDVPFDPLEGIMSESEEESGTGYDKIWKEAASDFEDDMNETDRDELTIDDREADREKAEKEMIEKCCRVCYPDRTDFEWPFHLPVLTVDAVLSEHYYEVHQIQDHVWEEKALFEMFDSVDYESKYTKSRNRLTCDKCNFTVIQRQKGPPYQKYRMIQHLQSDCDQAVELKRSRNCRKCDMSFEIDFFNDSAPPFKEYASHWGRHEDEGCFTCDYCGDTMTSKEQFQAHLATHDDKLKVPCGECGKLFVSEKALKHHMDYAHKDKEHCRCKVCKKYFKNHGQLESHMVRDHGHERQFKCLHCPADFIRQKALRHHTKTFHGPDSDPNRPISVRRRGPNKRPYPKKSESEQNFE